MANATRNVKKVMLAYSGGLDTSIIIPWLKENYDGAEVVAFCGDVGQGDDFEAVRRKALATGASKCIVKDLRAEFVARLLLQGALGGGRLRGPLPARHGARAAADRLSPGAGRDPRGRRRAVARRHRQGQRPGPLRGHLRRLRAAPHGDRPVARVDDPLARGRARLRAQARRARRPDQEGPLQPRRQPVAPVPRGRQPRGRVGRAAEGHVQADRGPARRAFEAALRHDRLRAGRAGQAGRQAARAGAHDRDAQPDRGGARRRPARPRREPARRHQVARRLRDACGHRAPRRAPRARAAGARPRYVAFQANGLRPLRRADLRRPLVLDLARGARGLRGRDREGDDRGGAGAPLQGQRRGRRPPLAAQPLPPGPRHLRRGHGLRPPGRRGLHPALRPARARARAHAQPRDGGREGGRGDASGAGRGGGPQPRRGK